MHSITCPYTVEWRKTPPVYRFMANSHTPPRADRLSTTKCAARPICHALSINAPPQRRSVKIVERVTGSMHGAHVVTIKHTSHSDRERSRLVLVRASNNGSLDQRIRRNRLGRHHPITGLTREERHGAKKSEGLQISSEKHRCDLQLLPFCGVRGRGSIREETKAEEGLPAACCSLRGLQVCGILHRTTSRLCESSNIYAVDCTYISARIRTHDEQSSIREPSVNHGICSSTRGQIEQTQVKLKAVTTKTTTCRNTKTRNLSQGGESDQPGSK